MSSSKSVRAVDRAFDILAAVAATGRASVHDIEQRTGLPRPTVLRIAATLMERGALRRGLKDERYHLGPTLAELAQGIAPRELLAAIAAPHLNALSDLTGWPAVVAVFEPDPGEYMRVLESSVKVSRFYVRSVTKVRINLLLSSIGLAFLAHQPASFVEPLLERLKQTRDPHNLLALASGGVPQKLADAWQRGYAGRDALYRGGSYDEPPADDRVNALAVPLLHEARAFGALNVYWNRRAMQVEQVVAAYLPHMREAAARIAQAAARRGVAQALLRELDPAGNPG